MKDARQNKGSQKGAVQRPGLLFILATAMIVLVIILAFMALKQIRRQILKAIDLSFNPIRTPL